MTTDAAQKPSRILYYGDNLEVLRNPRWFPDECVDLIYLDPPFKSQQDYNLLFKSAKGTPAAAQVQAFTDTWKWNPAAKAEYERLVSDPLVPGRVGQVIEAFYKFLDGSEMMAYLVMMTPRLLELHRALKPTGSLYLHCDPAASHYLKIVLDTIFGPTNFRNEIVWRRTASHNQARRFGPIHDTLLFYSKNDSYYFRPQYRPFLKGHVASYFRSEDAKGQYWTNALTGAGTRRGDSGKPWRIYDPTPRGRHWAVPGEVTRELGIPDDLSIEGKLEVLLDAGFIQLPAPGSQALPTYKQYLSESPGIPFQDIWSYQPHTAGVLYNSREAIDEDVKWLPRQGGAERLGYQTQKPLGVLRRIISTSCPDKGVVLDPFCGCGTAVVAAEELGRSWIGIDITYLAIDVMSRRLRDHFPNLRFEVRGQPRDVEGATALALKDRFQFQFWALSLIGAQAVVPDKRGPDRGIDGYLPYQDQGGTQRAIVSVKSGGVGVKDVRDLHGTMQREKADCGLLVTLEEPTAPMRKEAVEAGEYQMLGIGSQVPRIEILTIEDLLIRSRKPALAPYSPGPVAQAPRLRRRAGHQAPLNTPEAPETEP